MSKLMSSECFLVQSPLSSQDGVFFGRNAYRTNDEDVGAVEVIHLPAQSEAGDTQKCSSIEVKGAPTFAVVLNRPAGVVWGGDCGANEKRVSVAVSWSEETGDAAEFLTATDLTRLALERSASAEEAIETIAALVGVHNVADGQTIKQAFVICGENQIWLMNVVGKWWAAELLTDAFRQVGPGLSVGETITKSSENLKQQVLDQALWNEADPFNFGSIFNATESDASGGTSSAVPTTPFGLIEMFALLRSTATSSTGATYVSEIAADGGGSTPVTCHWFTATPNPTESVFKPFVFTRNVLISPLTVLAEDEPESLGVTRLHALHQQRNWAKVGPLLESLELSCVQEVHNFLSAAEAASQELDELLKDCVEAEVKFYR